MIVEDFTDRTYCAHCRREVSYNAQGHLFTRFGLGSSYCDPGPEHRHSLYDLPDLHNPADVEAWLSRA